MTEEEAICLIEENMELLEIKMTSGTANQSCADRSSAFTCDGQFVPGKFRCDGTGPECDCCVCTPI